jgi:hypothetical protein
MRAAPLQVVAFRGGDQNLNQSNEGVAEQDQEQQQQQQQRPFWHRRAGTEQNAASALAEEERQLRVAAAGLFSCRTGQQQQQQQQQHSVRFSEVALQDISADEALCTDLTRPSRRRGETAAAAAPEAGAVAAAAAAAGGVEVRGQRSRCRPLYVRSRPVEVPGPSLFAVDGEGGSGDGSVGGAGAAAATATCPDRTLRYLVLDGGDGLGGDGDDTDGAESGAEAAPAGQGQGVLMQSAHELVVYFAQLRRKQVTARAARQQRQQQQQQQHQQRSALEAAAAPRKGGKRSVAQLSTDRAASPCDDEWPLDPLSFAAALAHAARQGSSARRRR